VRKLSSTRKRIQRRAALDATDMQRDIDQLRRSATMLRKRPTKHRAMLLVQALRVGYPAMPIVSL
jgi:hypothetical protein